MNANVIAILVLVVGVPLNVLVSALLWRTWRAHPDVKVLRERLIVALVVLLIVVVFGLIFVNNDTIPPWLDLGATKVVTRFSTLALAVLPACYWLWLYFGPGED